MREYAIFLALNHEMADLRREEIRRQYQDAGFGIGDRVASALRSIRTAITTPADEVPRLTPSLSDYPYRS
jgi:hypothetical protein